MLFLRICSIKPILILLAVLPDLKAAGLSTLSSLAAGKKERLIETFLLTFLICQGDKIFSIPRCSGTPIH